MSYNQSIENKNKKFLARKKDELNQTKNQTKKRNQIFYKCKSSMRKLISYVYTQKYTKIPKFTRFGNRHFSQTNELPTNQQKSWSKTWCKYLGIWHHPK